MSQALMAQFGPMARRAVALGARAYLRNRKKRTRAGKWVLGSRLLGLPFSRNSTPRAWLRRRRGGNRGGGGAFSALDTRGVSTTSSVPVTLGAVARRVNAPMSRIETGNEDLGLVVNSNPSASYQCWSISINPAESANFARLAQLTTQFQRYKFSNIEVVFTPFTGVNQTGEVAFGFSPDPQHKEPKNMTELMGLHGAVRAPVYLPSKFTIPSQLFSKALGMYTVKQMATPATQDDSLINSVGRMYTAIQNCTATAAQPIGRLSCSYRLTLDDPITKPEGTALSGHYDLGEWPHDEPISVEDPVTEYVNADGVHPLYVHNGHLRTRMRYSSVLMLTASSAAAFDFELTDYTDDPAGVVVGASENFSWGAGPYYRVVMFKLQPSCSFGIVPSETLTSCHVHVFPCVHEMPLIT